MAMAPAFKERFTFSSVSKMASTVFARTYISIWVRDGIVLTVCPPSCITKWTRMASSARKVSLWKLIAVMARFAAFKALTPPSGLAPAWAAFPLKMARFWIKPFKLAPISA